MARTRRRKPGPKGKPAELVHLVIEIKQRNPSYGTPRIAMLINNVVAAGTISEPTVRRVLRRSWQPTPIRPRNLTVFLATCAGVFVATVSFVLFWIRWTIRQQLGAWLAKPSLFERFVGRMLTRTPHSLPPTVVPYFVRAGVAVNGSQRSFEAARIASNVCHTQRFWHRRTDARDGPTKVRHAA